jgi:DNA-binding GntR family transcriptional regulator
MPNKTLQAYKTLKDFIVRSKILPGERIYLEDLAKTLNLSLTPLREALNRLSQEDLVTHVVNRGYTLRVITNDEVRELFEFCEALEIYAIERAVKSIEALDLMELEKNLMEYKKIMELRYFPERFFTNNEFHMKIVKLGGNQLIVNSMERVFERLAFRVRLENFSGTRGSEVYAEHLAIYNALNSRDVRMAIHAMRDHIVKSKEFVLGELQTKEDYLASLSRTDTR